MVDNAKTTGAIDKYIGHRLFNQEIDPAEWKNWRVLLFEEVMKKYCIQPVKCIYEKCPYPSNKGIFERDFMEFCNRDGEVDAFCKTIENRHTFAKFRYIRDDGGAGGVYQILW